MNQQCMARNKADTARCERPATKMVATVGAPEYQPQFHETILLEPSVPTLRICGVCLRRLHSGAQSTYLELDSGERHFAWVGYEGREVVRTKKETDQ